MPYTRAPCISGYILLLLSSGSLCNVSLSLNETADTSAPDASLRQLDKLDGDSGTSVWSSDSFSASGEHEQLHARNPSNLNKLKRRFEHVQRKYRELVKGQINRHVQVKRMLNDRAKEIKEVSRKVKLASGIRHRRGQFSESTESDAFSLTSISKKLLAKIEDAKNIMMTLASVSYNESQDTSFEDENTAKEDSSYEKVLETMEKAAALLGTNLREPLMRAKSSGHASGSDSSVELAALRKGKKGEVKTDARYGAYGGGQSEKGLIRLAHDVRAMLDNIEKINLQWIEGSDGLEIRFNAVGRSIDYELRRLDEIWRERH